CPTARSWPTSRTSCGRAPGHRTCASGSPRRSTSRRPSRTSARAATRRSRRSSSSAVVDSRSSLRDRPGSPAGSGARAELLLQAPHGLGPASHAEEGALALGAFLEHLAAREDLAAQLLRRPGHEELGLDQTLPEERAE